MQEHHTTLVQAIENRLRVQFKYKSTDEDVATLRTVEPWVYGFKNGKESLLGYQVEPDATQKRFDLRRVKHIELLQDDCDQHPDHVDLTKWDRIEARWVPHSEAA